MGYCMLLPKGLVFIASAFFLTWGLFTMTMTIWMVSDSDDFVHKLGDVQYRNETEGIHMKYDFNQISVFVLVLIGLLLVIFAIFGFYATIFDKPYILFAFSVVIAIVLLFQIALGISLIVYEKEVDDATHDWLLDTLKSGYQARDERNFESFLWDETFAKYKCCGVNNATDFSYFNTTSKHWVPNSCCYREGISLAEECPSEDHKDFKGCFGVLLAVVDANRPSTVGVALAVAACELAVLAAASFLVRSSSLELKVRRSG